MPDPQTLPPYDDLMALLPTDRELRLRAWRPDDAPAVLAACLDRSTAAWIAPLHDYDEAKATAFVTGAAAHWAGRQHLRLCLTDESDRVLGSGDLDDLTFRHGRSELGWWIAPGSRGRGLGVRLARLLVRTGFEQLSLSRLTADIVAPNDSSRWVAAGAGLRYESTASSAWVGLDGRRHDMETWRLLADEEPLPAQPELTAGSLHLRPWRPGDAQAVFEACQDPDLQRWVRIPVPYELSDAQEFVGPMSLQLWAGGFGANYAVLDAVSGELLGCVGAEQAEPGVFEIGYWALPKARGRGTVTAATGVLLRWLRGSLGAEVFTWYARPDNAASWAVAAKLGFQREGVLRAGFQHRGGNPGPRLDVVSASLLASEVR